MNEVGVEPAAFAARLIRRPSVTPRDEGALTLVAEALEGLGFTCHRLVFGDASDKVHNLYARRST